MLVLDILPTTTCRFCCTRSSSRTRTRSCRRPRRCLCTWSEPTACRSEPRLGLLPLASSSRRLPYLSLSGWSIIYFFLLSMVKAQEKWKGTKSRSGGPPQERFPEDQGWLWASSVGLQPVVLLSDGFSIPPITPPFHLRFVSAPHPLAGKKPFTTWFVTLEMNPS